MALAQLELDMQADGVSRSLSIDAARIRFRVRTGRNIESMVFESSGRALLSIVLISLDTHDSELPRMRQGFRDQAATGDRETCLPDSRVDIARPTLPHTRATSPGSSLLLGGAGAGDSGSERPTNACSSRRAPRRPISPPPRPAREPHGGHARGANECLCNSGLETCL